MIHHNVKVGQSNFTFQIIYSPACPYSGSSLQSGELNSVTGLKVGCHLWYARLRQEKNERPRAEIKMHVFKSNLALHARSHQRNNTRIFSVAAMCICIFMHKLLIRYINYWHGMNTKSGNYGKISQIYHTWNLTVQVEGEWLPHPGMLLQAPVAAPLSSTNWRICQTIRKTIRKFSSLPKDWNMCGCVTNETCVGVFPEKQSTERYSQQLEDGRHSHKRVIACARSEN
jgi:hypothetical protein